MKPLLIDLFCGLGGWTRAFLDEGWDCVGFDIERHDYGTGGYPGQLVLQDVCTLEGRQIAHVDCIVASSPCQEFSYRAMPWKRAKALGPPVLGIKLFWQAFRLQREIELATGRKVPLIAENVCGAQKWIGRAAWHYGSFYLWGDIPALMPQTLALKVPGFRSDGSGRSFQTASVKVSGLNWSGSDKPGYKPQGMNTTAAQRYREGQKNGGDWFGSGENCSLQRKQSSRSDSRKAASAMIAMIPYQLAQHIARVYKPDAPQLRGGADSLNITEKGR